MPLFFISFNDNPLAFASLLWLWYFCYVVTRNVTSLNTWQFFEGKHRLYLWILFGFQRILSFSRMILRRVEPCWCLFITDYFVSVYLNRIAYCMFCSPFIIRNFYISLIYLRKQLQTIIHYHKYILFENFFSKPNMWRMAFSYTCKFI